ncbi:MAG: hypothetical protein NZ555_10525 [Geminicoccaceae bacterium]|nr:hypothetical protein [Geminicoccaceae bacterium]
MSELAHDRRADRQPRAHAQWPAELGRALVIEVSERGTAEAGSEEPARKGQPAAGH